MLTRDATAARSRFNEPERLTRWLASAGAGAATGPVRLTLLIGTVRVTADSGSCLAGRRTFNPAGRGHRFAGRRQAQRDRYLLQLLVVLGQHRELLLRILPHLLVLRQLCTTAVQHQTG